MKISVTEKNRSGVMAEFAKAIGAQVKGRYIRFPEKVGGGYVTGYTVDDDLRIIIRNFYLKKDVVLERRDVGENPDYMLFLFCSISATLSHPEKDKIIDKENSVLVASHSVSSILTYSAYTFYKSVMIGASNAYLKKLFGEVDHPIVQQIVENKGNFAFETSVTPEMIRISTDMINISTANEKLEKLLFKFKA